MEVANGFSNRFLWALVRKQAPLPNGGNIKVIDKYKPLISEIITKAKSITEVIRSAEAEKLWASVYESLRESKAGAYGKAVERGRPIVVRLSLIYALLDGKAIIEIEHLKAALAVWRYCDDSARIIFDNDKTPSLRNRIIEAVSKQPGIMRTELKNEVAKKKTTREFDNVLCGLLQENEIVCVSVMEGRQADRYYPAVPTPTEHPQERKQEQSIAETKQEQPPTNETIETKIEIDNNPIKNDYSEIEIVEDIEPLTPTKDIELSTDEFIYQLTKLVKHKQATTPTLSLVEILDWRNRHAIDFVQAGKEAVIVKQEQRHLMTADIENAIDYYADKLYPLAVSG